MAPQMHFYATVGDIHIVFLFFVPPSARHHLFALSGKNQKCIESSPKYRHKSMQPEQINGGDYVSAIWCVHKKLWCWWVAKCRFEGDVW
jgi:hypothetical protein